MRPSGRRAALSVALLLCLGLPAIVSAVEVGQRAPAFSLPVVGGDGGRVELSSLKGQVVVLDFWASWCGPCLKAMPELDSMARELSGKGVRVLAVSVDEEASAAQKALGGGAHAFTSLLDADMAVAKRYGVGDKIPATVVIDRQGTVKLFKREGAVEGRALRRLIRSLL